MSEAFTIDTDTSGPTGKDVHLLFASKTGVVSIQGTWSGQVPVTVLDLPLARDKVRQVNAAKKQQRRDKERQARHSRRKNRSR